MAGKYKVLGLTTESGNAYLKKIINGSGFEFAGLLELEPRNLDKIVTPLSYIQSSLQMQRVIL